MVANHKLLLVAVKVNYLMLCFASQRFFESFEMYFDPVQLHAATT